MRGHIVPCLMTPCVLVKVIYHINARTITALVTTFITVPILNLLDKIFAKSPVDHDLPDELPGDLFISGDR